MEACIYMLGFYPRTWLSDMKWRASREWGLTGSMRRGVRLTEVARGSVSPGGYDSRGIYKGSQNGQGPSGKSEGSKVYIIKHAT